MIKVRVKVPSFFYRQAYIYGEEFDMKAEHYEAHKEQVEIVPLPKKKARKPRKPKIVEKTEEPKVTKEDVETKVAEEHSPLVQPSVTDEATIVKTGEEELMVEETPPEEEKPKSKQKKSRKPKT